MNLLCTSCGKECEVDALVFQTRRSKHAGLPFPCTCCGADLYHTGEAVRRRAPDNQKRSQKQERRVAAREGGRRQPGSGARDGFEGDVRCYGRYRGECKFTRACSYSLKLADLKKLEAQAAAGELPVFDLEFQCESPARRYVIMPEWAYETLMEESGRRSDAGQDSNNR